MKNFTIILFLASFLIPESAFGEATQGNWRWRIDDDNEANATWAAQENESIVINSDDIIRLRTELYDNSGMNVDLIFSNIKLGYKLETETAYTTINESVDENHFVLAQSSQFEDGDPTTHQLSNFHPTFFSGLMIESSEVKSLNLPGVNSTELEFAIKPTSNIENGIYHFKIIDDNQTLITDNTQISLTFNGVITSLPDNKNTTQFEISPNPVVNFFSINGGAYPAMVKIIDLNGRLILSRDVAKNESVDISSLKKGIYMVSVNNEIRKIIKE